MQMWGQLQEMLKALEVHQLVSQLESSMRDAMTQFAQDMYGFMGDEVAKLKEGLNALGADIQDMYKNQVSEEHLWDFATSGQVQAVDARVTELDSAYRSYVDHAMAIAHTRLQAEISGRVVMLKAGF